MTGMHSDYVYCSSLLPVQSLDAYLASAEGAKREFRDPGDSPEDALIKKRDGERLHLWLNRLHPRLAAVAKLLMAGETQAAIARHLHLTEAAISKRIKNIRAIARVELADLGGSPLLT